MQGDCGQDGADAEDDSEAAEMARRWGNWGGHREGEPMRRRRNDDTEIAAYGKPWYSGCRTGTGNSAQRYRRRLNRSVVPDCYLTIDELMRYWLG